MRPNSQARTASARVLKKRAAQSHLSMRIPFTAARTPVVRSEAGSAAAAESCFGIDFPDVQMVCVARSRDFNAALMSCPVKGGANVFLTVGQRRQRDFERGSGLQC